MPPSGSKRKRTERRGSRDEGSGRPSPYRPQDQGLAQQSQQNGGSRGGRSNGGGRRPSRQLAQSPANGVGAGPNRPGNETPTPTPQQQQQTSAKGGSPAVDISRTNTPSQSAPAIPQPPADDTPKQPPAPYLYEYVTDPIVESWEDGGKNNILEQMMTPDEMTAGVILQELVRAGIDGKLGALEAGSVIREMIAQPAESSTLDIQSLVLNTLSLLDDADAKSSKLLTLVEATNIDPEVLRLELDIPLLQALYLVRSSFTQMRARKTTNLLYRQANFNLLREETEGYAKLITEYFNTANEATHDHTVSAERAFERVTALVGSFDLDVGRVLDMTLDISANLLVRAYGFFIKFYRCSSWWPDSGVIDSVRWEDQGFGSFPTWALPGASANNLNGSEGDALRLAAKQQERDIRFWDRVRDTGMDAFYELGTRRILDFEDVLPLLQTEVPPELDAKGKEINVDRRKRINENRKFMAETQTLPPAGNSDAAQLLGFKLRFYASSARDAQDVLPDNLVFLAALLIKIGFISLRDLYPHLYPSDEKMADEKTRLEREKADKEAKERPGVAANALATAGALTDDTLPVAAARALRGDQEKSGANTPMPDRKEEDSKDSLPPPVNQKIALLKALLLIGSVPEALYILGRFPWLVDVDYTLPPYLHRIANQMLSKIAELTRPMNRSDAQVSKNELDNVVPRTDGTLLLQARPERNAAKWLGLDTIEKGDGMPYKHYYPDWDGNIPLCQNVEDVVLLCNSFLGLLGVKIGQDAKLLGTLIRVAKYSLSDDFSETNQTRWLDLMRRLLVPALSLSKHNAGLTQEVYELLKFFPTTTRYNIYAEWYRGKTSRLPDMRVAFDHNKAEVKDVLRRVTNESGKKQARALAKVSFSSPGNVMIMMINQLESYSNMIPSLVECTRYFPLLAYDILTWCLINSLSGQGRDRMQADGMLTSSWLQALSQFVASLFYRYTALNPSPVLQYLASELRAGNSTDLEMFEQLLAEMAGIRSDMEFNDAQVLAMAGGKQLRAQTVQQLADKRHDRKPQALRLIKALSDPGLIGQMLLSIAQERQMYSHHDSSKYMPLKVLGNNLDKIHLVLVQYLDVLTTNLSSTDFEAAVPDVVSLIQDFGLEPAIAFTICRFCLVHRMLDFDTAKKSGLEEKKRVLSEEQLQPNGDVEMREAKGLPSEEAVATDQKPEPSEAIDSKTISTSPLTAQDPETLPWHPVLQPIIQNLAQASPQLAERVSMPFFVCFWTRGLQDILVHTLSYDNEINKLRTQVKELTSDRADLGGAAVKERERKKKILTDTQDRLRDELKGRIASYQKTRNRISRQEKDHWFSRSMDREESDARHVGLLQECFLPRAMLSSLDAHYCFLMLKILHDNGTPGFSTMRLLAQLLRKRVLATLIFQCTALEAQHFGRFLSETLKLLQHWHTDKATYEREALGEKQKLPGFAKTLDANGDPQLVLDYEEYRRLLFNWHTYIYAALIICFESSEYMYIRNGIIVLRSIVQVFPSVNFMGHNMVKQVTKLSEEESRQDLKLAARSLLGPLKSREKQWVLPQAFRLSDPAKEGPQPGSRGPSARAETPQSSADTPKLNAAAQEFKPISSLASGSVKRESVAGTEDGEIEDEKQTGGKDVDAAAKVEGSSKIRVMPEQPTEKAVDVAQAVSANEVTKETSRPLSTRPPTPAAIPSRPPLPESSRAEASRTPNPQSTSSRSHALPSRLPNKPPPAPPGRFGARDDSFGRLTRPSDVRPASRDQSPGRSRPRTPERDGYVNHAGPSRGPPRDDRGAPRGARDESLASTRRDQPSVSRPSHASREVASTAINSDATQGSRPPPSGPHSAQSAQSARNDPQYHENPARMALINNDPMRDKDSRRERDARDERSAPGVRQSDHRNTSREAPRDSQAHPDSPSELAPTGPRRAVNGRLSRDFGPAMPRESTTGRLSGPQESSPIGRAPNGPTGNAALAGPNRSSGLGPRSQDLPPPSPSALRVPESPASFRGPAPRQAPDRRQSGYQSDRQPASDSGPAASATGNGDVMHPSRRALVEPQPRPVLSNVPAAEARHVGPPTTAPPAGPRGAARPPPGTPTGPLPSNEGPPSGPASASERSKRPTERRQVSSINATLQGANTTPVQNGQGVNFRGAATQSRPPTGPTSLTANSASVQAIASSMDAPPKRGEAPPLDRLERASNRPDSRADLFQPKRGASSEDQGSGRPGRGDDERTDRQRGSRNPSREPRPAPGGPEQRPPVESNPSRRGDDWRGRDDRETRGGGPPRESRFPERGPRNDDPPNRRGPPGGAPSSFPEQTSEWGERRSQPRRDGPDDGRRGGRDGGPNADFRGSRREDERRGDERASRDFEGPPPAGGGRKRRHEDVAFDESKRRRSGR